MNAPADLLPYPKSFDLILKERFDQGRNVVVIDIDNVIANTAQAQTAFMRAQVSIANDPDVLATLDDPSYGILYNPLLRKARQAFFANPNNFVALAVHRGVKESLEMLKISGYRVHFATNREPKLHQVTINWLIQNGLLDYCDGLHLLELTNDSSPTEDWAITLLSEAQRKKIIQHHQNNSHNNANGHPPDFKTSVCLGLQALVLIDDHHKNCNATASSGIPVMRVKRPYMGGTIDPANVGLVLNVGSLARGVNTLLSLIQ